MTTTTTTTIIITTVYIIFAFFHNLFHLFLSVPLIITSRNGLRNSPFPPFSPAIHYHLRTCITSLAYLSSRKPLIYSYPYSKHLHTIQYLITTSNTAIQTLLQAASFMAHLEMLLLFILWLLPTPHLL